MIKNRQTGPTTSVSCPRAMTLRPPSHIINTKIQFRNLQVVRSNIRKRYYLEVAMMCEGGRRWRDPRRGTGSHRARRFRSCFVDRTPRVPRRLEVVSEGREVSNPLVLHTQLSCSPSGVSVANTGSPNESCVR